MGWFRRLQLCNGGDLFAPGEGRSSGSAGKKGHWMRALAAWGSAEVPGAP